MSKEDKGASRRDFLKLASVSAPAAAAAVVAQGTEAEAAETGARGDGLRETAHSKAYYDSARF